MRETGKLEDGEQRQRGDAEVEVREQKAAHETSVAAAQRGSTDSTRPRAETGTGNAECAYTDDGRTRELACTRYWGLGFRV